MTGTPAAAMQCLICMDEVTNEARACGFCSKRICRTCLPHLVEINYEGEADEENGDLRCPNCRGSLVEGDLHKRRSTIATTMPNVSTQVAADIVTMEDLIARLMQLCASEEAGVSFYNVSNDIVIQAICRDPNYSAMLERVLKNARRARTLRYTLRKSPTDRGNVTTICKFYLTLLTQTIGLAQEHARKILEEVAQQALSTEAHFERYAAAWADAVPLQPAVVPSSPARVGGKRGRDVVGASSGNAAKARDSRRARAPSSAEAAQRPRARRA